MAEGCGIRVAMPPHVAISSSTDHESREWTAYAARSFCILILLNFIITDYYFDISCKSFDIYGIYSANMMCGRLIGDPSMTHWHPSRRTVLLGAAAGLFAAPRRVVAASGEPIRIGHQCDVTGGLASSGYWHRKTINVAAEWFNANGGFGGRPIEVIGIDTETKVDVGIARLRQLIQDQKVDFVIGSQHGGVALASTAIVRDEGVPYMSTSRSEGVTEGSGNPFVFRLIVNTRQTDLAAGKAMAEMVGKRRTVLYADYVWANPTIPAGPRPSPRQAARWRNPSPCP